MNADVEEGHPGLRQVPGEGIRSTKLGDGETSRFDAPSAKSPEPAGKYGTAHALETGLKTKTGTEHAQTGLIQPDDELAKPIPIERWRLRRSRWMISHSPLKPRAPIRCCS